MTDNNLKKTCLVCDGDEGPLTNCSRESFNHLKNFALSWSVYDKYTELHDKLSTENWAEGLVFYHRACYDKLTHKSNLNKLKRRKEAIQAKSKATKIVDFSLCIVCQEIKKDVASKVTSTSVAEDILKLKSGTSLSLKERLTSFNTNAEILERGIKYHSVCLLNEKKKATRVNREDISIEDLYKDLNDEYLNIIKRELTSQGDESATLDISQLVKRYEDLCRNATLVPPVSASSMRRYVRSLIESFPDLMAQADFYRYAPGKPSVLANKLVVSKLVCKKHYREDEEDESDPYDEVAKEIRKELSVMLRWEFCGRFDDFEMPAKLTKLINSIISDNKPLAERKQREIDTITCNIVQYFYSNFKSDRQLTYQSVKNRGFEKHRLTPLSVGMALSNYKENKSKKGIEFLSRIGLSINYDKLERILTSIATAAIDFASKNEMGIILPQCFKKGIRPIFAADNIDIGGDTSSFHGADLMIVQRNDPSRESLFPEFSFKTTNARSLRSSLAPEIDENVELSTDSEARFDTPLSIENSIQISEKFEQLNIIWLLLSQAKIVVTPVNSYESEDQEVDDVEHCTSEHSEHPNDNLNQDKNQKSYKSLSWSAFHSLQSDRNESLSNVAIVAPLYRRSPTEVPILMDILKRAANISALTVGEDKRTIITLDGDLYGRAVKIANYKSQWIIRLGSLHTVIAALKCLGKYIEGSGIDTAWQVSGMYGSATVSQIIEGRHIYRGIQAHTVTLIALYYLKIHSDIFSNEERQTIETKISNIDESDVDSFKQSILNMQQDFGSCEILKKLQLKVPSRKTATFLDNYTSQIMNLLNYIGATRNKNWLQHLSTNNDMSVYFHAHDQTNYSKWAVLYLADMLELQSTDIESWQFLSDGNFTVSSNSTPFTSIDPDHAIEHKHKEVKGGRGIADIKNNESALERFALTMPILSKIIEEFERYSSVKPCNEGERVHHELLGNFFNNQLKNAQSLILTLSREGNPYEYADLRNVMNFSVPSLNIVNNVCNRDELGAGALSKFRKQRMVYNNSNDDDADNDNNIKTPFWSPLPKNNWQMFSDINIIINPKQKTFTTMKKEKQLYARMLFVSKTRPELCPERVIGEYEFTSIPPSNFSPDGSLITSKSNESLIQLIMDRETTGEEIENDFDIPNEENSAIIVNAMEILDIIKKRKPLEKVSDLAKHFMDELKKVTEGFSEVRLIFKRFDLTPLNDYKAKDKNLKKVAIYFHVKNNTPIKNFDSFMAHVDTRIELSTFLGKMVFERFKDSTIKYLVAYENKYFVNKSLEVFTNLEREHNFMDIKQIIISNVVDIAKPNRNRMLTINSIDIDLIILLSGLFDQIPPYTTMKSGGKKIEIKNLYNRLGYKLSESIIGWYCFHGMKDQGTFYGKGVKTQFNAFLKADDDILYAFKNFGTTLEIPDDLIQQVERFICLLYGRNRKTIKELRFLMSGDGKDGNQLPPTVGTLVPHMCRAYYQALAFKMSIHSNPIIPPATNYYWTTTDDKEFVPVRCVNPPAPEAILELIKCGCAKTDCTSQACKCRKNNLTCCGLCKCSDGCSNVRKEIEEEIEEDDLI